MAFKTWHMTDYRAELDADITFSNGGGLHAEGFRLDVPEPDADEEEVATLLIASLGLLMTERVEVRNLRVFAEPHKGTRGGPRDLPTSDLYDEGPAGAARRLAELSHVISAGMVTYPGLAIQARSRTGLPVRSGHFPMATGWLGSGPDAQHRFCYLGSAD